MQQTLAVKARFKSFKQMLGLFERFCDFAESAEKC